MGNSPYTLFHISKASSRSITTARNFYLFIPLVVKIQRKTVKTTKKTEKCSLRKMEKNQDILAWRILRVVMVIVFKHI